MIGDGITVNDIRSITRSDLCRPHHRAMARTTQSSEFWIRLTSLPSFEGKTQTQVAAVVLKITGERYGQTGIQKWKAGTSTPGIDLIRKIAVKEGVAAEWLITGRGPRAPSDVGDPELAELIGLWKYLPSAARKHLLGQAKFERTVAFTGDAKRREQYQRDLVRLTESQRRLEQSIRNDPKDEA